MAGECGDDWIPARPGDRSSDSPQRMNETELRAVAARIGGRAELLDVRLRSGMCTALGEPSAEPQLTFALDIAPEVTALPDMGVLVVSCEFAITVSEQFVGDLPVTGAEESVARVEARDAAVRVEVARLTCTHSALYRIDNEDFPSEAECDAFAKTTGVFALYPYARAWLQDTTARMGLPPLTLGIYRVPIDDPNN